jgi:hypothetical protein
MVKKQTRNYVLKYTGLSLIAGRMRQIEEILGFFRFNVRLQLGRWHEPEQELIYKAKGESREQVIETICH